MKPLTTARLTVLITVGVLALAVALFFLLPSHAMTWQELDTRP